MHDAYLNCEYLFKPFQYACRVCGMHSNDEYNLVKLSLFIHTHQIIKKDDEYVYYECQR